MTFLSRYTDKELEEELERRKKTPPVVTYTVYLHSSKDTMYERAIEAGLSEDEIEKYDLSYIGYEVPVTVTVDRSTGKVTKKVGGV